MKSICLGMGAEAYTGMLEDAPEAIETLRSRLAAVLADSGVREAIIFGTGHTAIRIKEAVGDRFVAFVDSSTFHRDTRIKADAIILGTSPSHYESILAVIRDNPRDYPVVLPFKPVVIQKVDNASLFEESPPHSGLWSMRESIAAMCRDMFMLKIETVNTCTASCIFCAYRFLKRKKTVMPFELFRKVADEFIGIGGKAVMLSPVVGEMLADPLLAARAAYIRSKDEGIILRGISNFNIVPSLDERDLTTLLDCYDDISVSVAPNRKLYSQLFGVDRFDGLLEGLRRIDSLGGSYRCKIGFLGRAAGNFTVDPQLQELIHSISGSQTYWVTKYCDWSGSLDKAPPGTRLIRNNIRGVRTLPCKYATLPVVFAGGKAGFCGCADFAASLEIGDAASEHVGDILNGAPRLDLIDSFFNGSCAPYCATCSFYAPYTGTPMF